MPALDRLFPRKVCINLRRRPDRWRRVLGQFRIHGIQGVIRHEATDGSGLISPTEWKHGPGAFGCLLSHLDVVRSARNDGAPAVLILEDDVIFHPDFCEEFEACASQLPHDWDAVYLGGIHLDDPAPISSRVALLKNTFSTYAYGLRETAYAAFLMEAQKEPRPADHVTRAMQRQFRFYCFTPHLAWVAEDYSDIKNSTVNPWWLSEVVAMNGESVGRMLSQTVVILRMPEPDRAAENTELVQCATQFYADMKLRVRFLPASQAHPARICDLMEAGEEYAVIADVAVYPYQWEFKASLLKCLEFDRVLPIYRAVRLSEEDTRLVMRRQIHDVDTMRYERATANADDLEFCILSRAALSTGERGEPKTFYSPGRLLRLHAGGQS